MAPAEEICHSPHVPSLRSFLSPARHFRRLAAAGLALAMLVPSCRCGSTVPKDADLAQPSGVARVRRLGRYNSVVSYPGMNCFEAAHCGFTKDTGITTDQGALLDARADDAIRRAFRAEGYDGVEFLASDQEFLDSDQSPEFRVYAGTGAGAELLLWQLYAERDVDRPVVLVEAADDPALFRDEVNLGARLQRLPLPASDEELLRALDLQAAVAVHAARQMRVEFQRAVAAAPLRVATIAVDTTKLDPSQVRDVVEFARSCLMNISDSVRLDVRQQGAFAEVELTYRDVPLARRPWFVRLQDRLKSIDQPGGRKDRAVPGAALAVVRKREAGRRR